MRQHPSAVVRLDQRVARKNREHRIQGQEVAHVQRELPAHEAEVDQDKQQGQQVPRIPITEDAVAGISGAQPSGDAECRPHAPLHHVR
jgi:hypothetical protein